MGYQIAIAVYDQNVQKLPFTIFSCFIMQCCVEYRITARLVSLVQIFLNGELGILKS